MKKILLFVGILFFTLFQNKTYAQGVIDSIVTTQFIECPGDQGCLTVYISTAPGNDIYNIVLQQADALVQMQPIMIAPGPGNLTSYQFCPLPAGIFQILLVDPLFTPPYPTQFNYDPVNEPLIYSALTAVLINPLPLTVSASDSGLFCWDDVNAIITVDLHEYTKPYTVTLKDDNNNIISGPTTLGITDTSYSFPTGVGAGTYTICATDVFSCPEVCISHTITSPDTLIPSGSVDQEISCYAADDGAISVSASGGTPFSTPYPDDYTYSWTGPLGYTASGPEITNLGPGTYICLIADTFLCDTTISFTLVEPDSLGASTTFSNPICNGDNNGSITITLSSTFQGSGGPFEYSQNGGLTWVPFTNSFAVLLNLPAGIYTNNRVRDVNQCEFILPPDTLIEPDLLEFSYDALTYIGGYNVSCNGACDAEITIDSVWGGNLPPYGNSASFYGGVAFIDTLLNDTCVGFYTDTVTDSFGCIGTNSIEIFQPPVFTINASVSSPISCPGICDGQVNISPNNGQVTIDYSVVNNNAYTWTSLGNPPGTSVIATDICGFNTNGIDTVVAIDANGCVATDVVNLVEPPLFSYANGSDTLGYSDENCAQSNGSAWIKDLVGGDGNYSYAWTSTATQNLQAVDSISGLSYGMYYLQVTDGQGCSFIDSAFVDSAYILVDYTVNVPCNAIDNGAIYVNTNGVLLSEMILILRDTTVFPNLWDVLDSNTCWSYGSNGVLVQNNNISILDTFQGLRSTTGNEFYDLGVELYGQTINTNGCDKLHEYIYIGDSVSMDASLDLSLSNLDLLCYGDSTSEVEIKVHDSFVDTLGFPLPASPWNNSYGADVSGGLFNTSVSNTAPFNVLFNPAPPPGLLSYIFAETYTVIITSNLNAHANCIDTVSFVVTEPDSLQFTLGSTPALCNGSSDGTVYVDTIFGGTSTYSYTWKDASGAIVSFQDTVVGLQAGWYSLTVIDANLCPLTIDSVEVLEPTLVSYIVDTLQIDICSYTNPTGQFLLSGLGGVGQDIAANYTYNWWNYDSSYATIIANPNGLVSGWYYFIVTDGNGCVTDKDSAFIPNGVDPILDQSHAFNVSCFGADDGSYTAVVDSLNPLGSSASPFAFWNPATSSYDPSYIPQGTSLGPDTIVIQMVDDIGCQAFDTIFITEPTLLEITHFDTLTYIGGYNVTCNGSLNGELTIHAIGGTLDYIYWIQDSTLIHPTSSDSVFSGLASTYYKAFVQDDNGCLDSLDIYLSQPDSLLIDSFVISTYFGGWNVSCKDGDNGQANVFISGGNLGYSYDWSNGDTTNIAYNLENNTYTVTVTDTNGCTVSGSTITLTEPPTFLVIDSIISNSPLLCKGGDDGEATVYVSGSTPGYTYLWDNANSTIPTYFNPSNTVPSLNDTSAFADTLRAGTYNVDVWDTNGCYVTGSVTITEPSISITIDSLAVTQMTCFTYNDASVQIFTTGPQPIPYFYTLYNAANELDTIKPFTASPAPQGNIAFSALGALTYVVYVEDDLGCLDRDTFTINPLNPVGIDSITYSNVSCYGYDDGYIEVIYPTQGGGTPPYEYSINGGVDKFPSWVCNYDPNTCPTGYVFTGLGPGTHTVEIWDANGCVSSYNIIITEPPAMAVNYSPNDYNNFQIPCYGGTGEVIFNIAGAVAPYDISTGGNTVTTSGSFTWTGLGVGTHNFNIVAANGCLETVSITLNEPPVIAVSPLITDVFCTDSCTGEITAVVSGGVGQGIGTNYTYQWNDASGPISGETSYYIDDLCPGIYTIDVTDGNNCTSPFTIVIGENALNIAALAAVINNVECYGDCDGSITVNPILGVPSSSGTYTYLWDDPLNQTTQTAIGLCAGFYTCTVTDMEGCVDVATFQVIEPNELIATIIVQTPIACHGGTGSISITTTGGNNSFLYDWSTGSNGQVLSNLVTGSYSCFVTDNLGCSDTAHYYLDQPDILEVLNIKVTEVGCKDSATGVIDITATGGTPFFTTYDYILNQNGVVQNAPAGNFTNLSTGMYTVTVIDAKNCSITTNNIFVDEPDNYLDFVIDIYDETCSNPAGATVFPSGGTFPYDIVWDGNNPANSGIFKSLTSGSNVPHSVVVTDKNGCSDGTTITLLAYLNVFPGNAAAFTANKCIGDQIVINIAPNPGFSYLWTMHNGEDTIGTNATLNVTTDFSWLQTEYLTLTITDPACIQPQSVTATINLTSIDPDPTVLNEDAPITILEGTSITLSSNSGYATYEWTNFDGELLSNNSQFSTSPIESGKFYLYVTDGNCIGYDSIYVAVGVMPVDAISPNGDGVNENWYIQDLNSYEKSTVQLFNRWGDLLFEYKGESDRITNDDIPIDWEDLNIGTYYYIIDLGNGSLPQTGPLTIIK